MLTVADEWLLCGLRLLSFGFIMVDPPWTFETYNAAWVVFVG
jgi:hypothetical protein